MRLLVLIILLFQSWGFAKSSPQFDIKEYSLNDDEGSETGVIFTPAFTYLSINETNSVSGVATAGSPTRSISFYDLKLGHVFNNGIYFGVSYAIENQNIDNANPTTDRTSFGISLGYKYQGFLGIAHYYLTSKQKVSSTTDPVGDYSDGSGFQIDLSYHWEITNYFLIGPMLSYKNFNYKKAEAVTTGTDATTASSHSTFVPMINVIVYIYRS